MIMGGRIKKWAIPAAAFLLLAAGLVYAFWPRPIPVSIAQAERGPLMVTVDEEGQTRVKDVYTISAPIPGRVARFEGDVGDTVIAGKTVVAAIRPSEPAFHDVRTHTELEAAVKAAEAARDLAKAEVAQAEATRDFAEAEYKRVQPLAERGTYSKSAFDKAHMEAQTAAAALDTAKASLRVREFELQTARAALLDPGSQRSTEDEHCCFTVYAPVSGTILRVFQESEAVVTAGAPLVEIGNPADLEIVVDFLSTDAVKVSPGDEVLIEGWGGEKLHGRVRRIEPFAFTKVSALGIEEQRVNVIVDFTDPPEAWKRLGHGYRIIARIVLWRSADVLQVPLSALFRENGEWALFKVVDGRARQTPVSVGHMNNFSAEILSGIEPGDEIILHPSDRVRDGTRVVKRDIS